MAGDWQYINLAEAPVEIIDGDRGNNYPKQSDFAPRGHCLFLNAGNVTANGFNFGDCAFISREKDDALRKGKLQRDDVVLTTRGTVGNVAYYSSDVTFDHIRINSGMVILRTDPKILTPQFLYQVLRSNSFSSQVATLRTGSAQPQLPIRDINRIVIPVPPLAEQRAIASILGSLDDKIELNLRMTETVKGIARALFKAWFVDFDPVRAKIDGQQPAGMSPEIAELFPGAFEHVNGEVVPKGWQMTRLAELLSESRERIGDTEAPEYSSTNSGLELRSDRFKKALSKTSAKNKVIRRGYLVFGLSRQVLNFGLMLDEIGSVSGAYKVFKIDETRLDAEILERLMRARPEYFYGAVSASSREGQSISIDGLGLLSVALPPIEVQLAYRSSIQTWTTTINLLTRESETIAALRDALIPKLLSGELRVPEAEQLVEEVL